jgi:TonB family protein
LDEERGVQVALNTKEYLYASYIDRIRRLVNFYWDQNLDNAWRTVRLTRSSYTTRVEAILNADGALELIEVVDNSGSTELDDCVVRAFRMAGPFPNPPAGMIEKDGRVYLPSMAFTVRLGTAKARFSGVDPRSGVQYPGLLKSPR